MVGNMKELNEARKNGRRKMLKQKSFMIIIK
jgi:hypothetical protein